MQHYLMATTSCLIIYILTREGSINFRSLTLPRMMSQDYGTNEAFVFAVKEAENRDRGSALQRIGAVQGRTSLQNVGRQSDHVTAVAMSFPRRTTTDRPSLLCTALSPLCRWESAD